jgi:hypothetical protein
MPWSWYPRLLCRVPETIVGCHFDGIDIERWVSEGLVDFLALVTLEIV